ncbi:unnamed protein product [Rhizoctonia solani]|uniref:Uncharacterized protein n=1 Tax=Rhizoctonia solani TaxID=456999 RepID=A0A8H3HS22_9AGAM|nr:unnamed protein product [Rhizoctonia solani]
MGREAIPAAQVGRCNWPTANARRRLEGRSNSTDSTTPTANNGTASYYIIGDTDTVAVVMDGLVTGCSVVRTSGIAVNETNPSIYFGRAVKFYRASSFMLLLTSYNNTATDESAVSWRDDRARAPMGTSLALQATLIGFILLFCGALMSALEVSHFELRVLRFGDSSQLYSYLNIRFSLMIIPIVPFFPY